MLLIYKLQKDVRLEIEELKLSCLSFEGFVYICKRIDK